MKKILVIGSAVVDVIINVDKLPTTKGDIHIKSQQASMGGCAYIVSDIIRHFKVPNILFAPVGTGIYGDFVRGKLAEKGLEIPIPTPDMPNGCCYCFVEENGERTFISNHGAEYLIYTKWLETIDMSQIQSIYICGLEIEEKTGGEIVAFLEKHRDIPIFFAPGPRIMRINPALLKRIYALNPIMHINDDEIKEYTDFNLIERAAKELYRKTKNTVIITCGSEGAARYDGKDFVLVDAVKVNKVTDTIGAGDSHIGAVMSCLYEGKNLTQALHIANKVAAGVVKVKGGVLSDEEFEEAIKED